MRVNLYYIVLFVFVDFMIGLIMMLLYICYVLVYDIFWLIKIEGYFWIVIVIVIIYSLSVVSLDRFVVVVYFLYYY